MRVPGDGPPIGAHPDGPVRGVDIVKPGAHLLLRQGLFRPGAEQCFHAEFELIFMDMVLLKVEQAPAVRDAVDERQVGAG